MQKGRTVLGFYKDHGKTKPITKSTGQLKRKKVVKNPRRMNAVRPNGSRWTLTYKRTRQLKQLCTHFLEKYKPKCFFCHQPITEKDLPDNITEHHINGDHNDNRPENKALAHEIPCHRRHHYEEVAPNNGIRKLGPGKHNPQAEIFEYHGRRFVLVPIAGRKGEYIVRVYSTGGMAQNIGHVGKMRFTRQDAFEAAKKWIDDPTSRRG
jgi:hypothetical protein